MERRLYAVGVLKGHFHKDRATKPNRQSVHATRSSESALVAAHAVHGKRARRSTRRSRKARSSQHAPFTESAPFTAHEREHASEIARCAHRACGKPACRPSATRDLARFPLVPSLGPCHWSGASTVRTRALPTRIGEARAWPRAVAGDDGSRDRPVPPLVCLPTCVCLHSCASPPVCSPAVAMSSARGSAQATELAAAAPRRQSSRQS